MNIKATFIGTDSLGYKNSEEYTLKIKQYSSMKIELDNGKQKCIYNSLSAFLRNWNNIRHL